MKTIHASLNSYTALTGINIQNQERGWRHLAAIYLNDVKNAAVLHASLICFHAIEIKGEVTLKWVIEKESHCSHFSLERSADGENFTSIGMVEGLGISDDTQHYIFKDKNAPTGEVYYRLVQFNETRILNVSHTLHLNITRYTVLKVQPEPTDALPEGHEANEHPEGIQLVLKNAYGKIIFSSITDFVTEKKLEVSLPDIPSGIYTLHVDDGSEAQKLMLVK